MFDFWRRRDKKQDSDEFSDLDNFDFDDFGFESEPVKDDRSPLLKGGSAFAESTIGAFRNADIEDSVKRALPDEYGEIFDVKDKVKSAYREVVDSAVKEFQPYKEDIKKLSQKVLNNTEKLLPEKLYKRLSDLVKTEERWTTESREVRERAAINAELASIFETQTKIDQERESRQDKKEEIRSVIAHQQFQDSFSQLDAIRRAVISQVEYQDNIALKYQRKHLEHEIKQTNILYRLAEETSAFRAESKTALDIITKNTGLPDYVKQLGSERLKATASQRFYDKTIDYLHNGNHFISRFLDEAKEGAKGWVTGLISGIGQSLSIVSPMDSSMDFGDEFKPTKAEMAGGALGAQAGEWLKNKSLGKLRDFLTGKKKIFGKTFPYADQINAGGHQAQVILANLPYYLNEFVRSVENSDSRLANNALTRTGINVLDDLLFSSTIERRKTLKTHEFKDLFAPVQFTNHVSRSITEVIPGYLSRILRELVITRTGNPNTPPILYNFQANKFDTPTNIARGISESIVGERRIQAFERNAVSAFDDMIQDNSLTTEDKKKLARLLHKSIGKRNINFNKAFLTNPATYRDTFGDEKASMIASMMQEYLKDDNGEKLNSIIRKYGGITGSFNNVAGHSQLLMDAGYGDIMRNMGLIDNDSIIQNDYLYDTLMGNVNIGEDSIEDSSIIHTRRRRRSTPTPTPIDRNRHESILQSIHDEVKLIREKEDKADTNNDYRDSLLEKIENIHVTNKEILEAIVNIGSIQIINNSQGDSDNNDRGNRQSLLSRLSSMVSRGTVWSASKYKDFLVGYTKLMTV